ncbi:hypothetical protein [Pseudoalteromonas tetraodonis]|uniref:hypothetical protein n=1 Tax=Pseudoalteromonas tetraodonis TaxID=43659 RepID=UPI003002ECFC
MLIMESAKNIHDNICRLAAEQGLNGTELARRSMRYGSVSQKTVSNIMRKDGFDPASCNIGVNKLDVLAKTLKVTPHRLIMPVESHDSFTGEELESSLSVALSTLAEMEMIEAEDFEKLNKLVELIAAAQFSVLVRKEDSPLKSLVKFFVRKMKS